MPDPESLAPREREIFEVIYRLGPMTAAEVAVVLGGTVSKAAVRSLLSRLCAKDYLYRPSCECAQSFCVCIDQVAARRSALSRVVRVFFKGSAVIATCELLEISAPLSMAELQDLQRLAARSLEAAEDMNHD